jgi:hypothetical protein
MSLSNGFLILMAPRESRVVWACDSGEYDMSITTNGKILFIVEIGLNKSITKNVKGRLMLSLTCPVLFPNGTDIIA